MPKTALIVRHTPYEGIAGFRLPIEQAGYVIDRIDVADAAFSHVDWTAPDLVALMGGPMGVYEQEAHPWIAGEIVGLSRRIAARRPTLGVCLGSQMIAAALGARVYPAPVKEVGFAPVALTAAGAVSPLRHVAEVPMLHWHGDTFDLPDDAVLLAATHLTANQAFTVGDWLLAIQFHPEMGEDPRIEAWMDGAAPYVAAAGTDLATVRSDYASLGPAAVAGGRALLAEWLAGLPRME